MKITETESALLPTTNGPHILIDSCDWDSLSKYKWRVNNSGYVYKTAHDGERLLHRIVNKTPVGMSTDHINGSKLDNRAINLRTCTHSQNGANKSQRVASTGFKGVYHAAKQGEKILPFVAQIKHGKKAYHIGSYSTAEEAARAHDLKAREVYGEFARLNYPD